MDLIDAKLKTTKVKCEPRRYYEGRVSVPAKIAIRQPRRLLAGTETGPTVVFSECRQAELFVSKVKVCSRRME